jgi:hypothetical protein
MVRLELLNIDDLIAGSRCFASLLEDSVKIMYTFYIFVNSILIIEQSCNALYSFSLLNWREEYLLLIK